MSNPLPIADLLAAMPPEEVTAQMIVEAVAKHLWVQNKQSIVGMMCMYRHPENLQCAVGVLIPDRLYNARYENHRLHEALSKYEFPAYFTLQSHLLACLQEFHDTVFVPNMTIPEYRVALRYCIGDSVDYSFLDSLPSRSSTENSHAQ